jgi:reductive dehalogenase
MAQQAPGWDIKWQALINGRTRPNNDQLVKHRGEGRYLNWLGIAYPEEMADPPADRGMPNWTGTPEEGSHLLQAAMRYYGSCLTGFAELDERWRNHIVVKYTSDDDTLEDNGYFDETPWPPPDTLDGCHPVVYENVQKGYSTPSKFVIPTGKPMYAMVTSGMDSMSITKCQKYPPFRFSPNGSAAIDHHEVLHYSTVNFLRALGDYQCLGLHGHQEGVLPVPSAGVLVGIGEQSRQNNLVLSPEYAFAHNPNGHIIDLPVAPTKPIDAGLFRFCHSCHKCADACPFGVISFEEEPTFDATPVNGKEPIFHVKGAKSFWTDSAGCRLQRNEIGGCGACVAACTFMVENGAMIHNLIKGTVAYTSLFNGFFYQMSKTFDFGRTEPDDWWDMSHPVFGIDTTIVAQTGYRH